MEDVIYEKETVTEEVFNGELPLDGNMTPEEQDQAIFKMMREAGIEVGNESEYHIGYVGADDNNGISETQTSRFVVTRTYEKNIPFKVTREEVYKGEWPQDGIRMTEEEQREKIFAEMEKAGIKVDNKDELEIAFEGAIDYEGVSETLINPFTVYRVKKEKLNLTEEEIMKRIRDELVELRNKVTSSTDSKEISMLSDKIIKLSDQLDTLVEESSRDYSPFEKTLEDIEQRISEVQDAILERMKNYSESYERIKEILKDQTSIISEQPEDLDKKIQEIMGEKLAENEQSIDIRKEIDRLTEELNVLVKKRNRVRKDFEAAKQLGLSAAEYKELTDNFRSRKLVNAILERKGLGDIIAIPAKERTAEQKRRIKTIRKEILDELAKEKKAHADKSILNLVEALYGIETEVQLKGKQRVLIVKSKSIENIKKNASKMPEKIIVKEPVDTTSYVPGEAPEDMQEVMERVQLEQNGVKEKITFFRDPKNKEKIYARSNVFERFNLEPVGKEIRVDDGLCFEIKAEDVDNLVANNNNDLSPYIVEFVDTEINEEEHKEEIEEDTHDYSEDESDEYIPGTNYKKPRNRGVYETDEEYVEFLRNYYNRIFGTNYELNENNEVVVPEEENEVEESAEYVPGTKVKRPREREVNETDEEYTDYLANYYKDNFGIVVEDDKEEEKEEEKAPTIKEIPKDQMSSTIREIPEYVVEDDKETTKEEVIDNEEVTIPEEVVEDVSEDINVEDTMPSIEANEDLERKVTDRVTIYRDNNEKYYAYKPVFDRFDIEPIGDEVRLEDIAGYEILPEDVEDIVAGQNNDFSPYEVEFKNITLEDTKTEDQPVEVVEEEPVEEEEQIASTDTGKDMKENIIIYRDNEDRDKYYAYKPVFDRFDIEPIGDEVRLEGIAGYELLPEDVEDILSGQNNDFSPYTVEFRNITLENTKGDDPVPPPEDPKPPVDDDDDEKEDDDVEIITLFRDINDNYQVYAKDENLQKFGIKALAEPTMIQGFPCHKISSDTDQIINSIAKMSKNQKLKVEYVDVEVKEKEETVVKPHVEDILDKLTTDLDIRAKDCKRYQASNLRISKNFKDELHSGNYAYNIVHIVPATLKAGISFFRKLSGKLLTSARAEKAMKTIEERLSTLSDAELEVLFEEYKGTQLKTDMNNQINPLILSKLKEFGLAKVEVLNTQIRNDYIKLFTLLGQIKALEEKMTKSGKEDGSLEAKRRELMKQASVHVQSIIDCRTKANNLLSSGVHGIEEDFKAVQTKLSYVGMRFSKTNDFDTDLQHQLGLLGRRLNTAIAHKDDEAIVQNFMGLESCYYDNTEIRGSLAGKRSVGSKYYSPVAEQFDYRDDPFIRDLFTTVAVTSAAVSAINAIRVHQIESQQASLDQVHQMGKDISDKRATFEEGMKAQAQQDILNNANVRERAHLDLTDWQFNDAYHAADSAGHAAYNQFYVDVNNQLNAVSFDYASGVISQAEALQRVADISNNAHATLRDVVDSGLQILRPYAQTHPQFDLTAVEQSMDYIVSHPNAIADMNQAMVDVANIGDQLQQLSSLGTLPSDMASTLVCAASAAVLAGNVANTMNKAVRKKGEYGNDITDMMDDYLYGVEVEEEQVKQR